VANCESCRSSPPTGRRSRRWSPAPARSCSPSPRSRRSGRRTARHGSPRRRCRSNAGPCWPPRASTIRFRRSCSWRATGSQRPVVGQPSKTSTAPYISRSALGAGSPCSRRGRSGPGPSRRRGQCPHTLRWRSFDCRRATCTSRRATSACGREPSATRMTRSAQASRRRSTRARGCCSNCSTATRSAVSGRSPASRFLR
jgi:hypothetical protein